MKRAILFLALLALLALAPQIVAQPPSACPTIVNEVLTGLENVCSDMGRNQACYGNVALQAIPSENATSFNFSQVGDIEAVTNLQSLRLAPMNVDSGDWGVALMQLQTNLPNTLPGQNVTFVLFGDVEMTNAATSSEAAPMQAFYLRTGIGAAGCEEAPTSGLLVQSPEGAGEIQFAMNGMNVSVGSTAYFTAQKDGNMQVSMLDGAGALRYDGRVVPVLEGTSAFIPLNDALEAEGEPEPLGTYEIEVVEQLPLDILPNEEFELAEPLTEEALLDLQTRIENGEPICGEDGLQPCEELPFVLGGSKCPINDEGEQDCALAELSWEWGDAGFGDVDYNDISYFAAVFDEDLFGYADADYGDFGDFGNMGAFNFDFGAMGGQSCTFDGVNLSCSIEGMTYNCVLTDDGGTCTYSDGMGTNFTCTFSGDAGSCDFGGFSYNFDGDSYDFGGDYGDDSGSDDSGGDDYGDDGSDDYGDDSGDDGSDDYGGNG